MSNDFLYWFGFYVEYRLLCLARGLAAFTRWFVRVLGALLTAVLRPVALGCIQLRQALRRPKAWLGLVVPVAGVLAFAWLVRTWLGQPFALRVEVNGTVVGYVASEQDFDTARADVQARVNTARALLEAAGADVPNWDLDPAFTLAVSADTMTPGEVANAILQASGSEITAGTAVYVDGALRFVTTEGDHLRTLLAAVRRPYMDPADADSRVVFAHELTLADGIYLTGSVSPYTEVVSALQANDGELLRVQILRRIRPSVAVHLGHPHRVRQDGNGPDISGRKVSLRPIEDASIQVDGDPVAVIGDGNAVLQAVNLQKGPGHSPNLHPQRRAPWAFKPHGRTIHLVPCDRGSGWERQFSVRDFIISLRLSGNIMDGRPGHQKPILYALHPAGLDHTGNGGCLIGNGKIHPSRIRLHAILRLADAPDGVGLPSEKTVIGKLDVFCTIDISGIPQGGIFLSLDRQKPAEPVERVPLLLAICCRERIHADRKRVLNGIHHQRWL